MNLDLVKTVTFALLHFSVGFGVTYLLTGSVAISTGVALIEPSVNTVVFFFHEKAWRALQGRALQGRAGGRRFAPRLRRRVPPGTSPAVP